MTLQRRYRFDGILINLLGTDPQWEQDVRQIETSARRQPDRALSQRRSRPAVRPTTTSTIFPAAGDRRPTLDEVDPDRVYYDDPHGVGGQKYPFYFGLEPYVADRHDYWPDYLFRTIDLVLAEVAGQASVHSEVFSPWTQLMELFGYEQALMYMLDDPAKIHAILAAYTEGTADLACRQAQRGVDAVLISSAFAGGGFISPAQYDEFVLPYERQVIDRVHQLGVPVYTHTCGRIGDRLEQMVATGLDGIDTLDPPPLGTVDLADAKQRVGVADFLQREYRPGQYAAGQVARGGSSGCPCTSERGQSWRRLHSVQCLFRFATRAARELDRAGRGGGGVWDTRRAPPVLVNLESVPRVGRFQADLRHVRKAVDDQP